MHFYGLLSRRAIRIGSMSEPMILNGREMSCAKLYAWINDKVRSISIDDDRTELDVEGMNQYLPDDFDETPLPPSSSSEPEGEKGAPKEIELQARIVDKTMMDKSPSISAGDTEDDGGRKDRATLRMTIQAASRR